MSQDEPRQPVPVFQVVKGHPTDEELAALLTVLTARSRVEPAPAAARPNGWSAYWRSVRAPLQPGPGAWQASGRAG